MNYSDSDSVPAVWQVGDVILDKYEVRQVFEGDQLEIKDITPEAWAKARKTRSFEARSVDVRDYALTSLAPPVKLRVVNRWQGCRFPLTNQKDYPPPIEVRLTV